MSGKTRDGNKWLRRTLCQAAWAATRKKDCYLPTQFRKPAARRGRKRAIIAVAHSILIIAYTMLQTDRPYQEPGGTYLEQLNKDQLQRYKEIPENGDAYSECRQRSQMETEDLLFHPKPTKMVEKNLMNCTLSSGGTGSGFSRLAWIKSVSSA